MKQFKLVRYVTIGSIAFFIFAIALLAFMLRANGESNLLDLAERNNVRLTKLFAKSVEVDLHKMFRNPDVTYDNDPGYDPLLARVRDHMGDLEVLKVKIFTPSGLTVFSTELAQLGQSKITNLGFLSAMQGIPKSELTHRDQFSAFDEVVEDRDVISSYVPVYIDGQKTPSGVFEVYSDVTPLFKKYEQETIFVTALAAGLFIVLWGGLFIIIRRADGKLNEQVEENQRTKLHMAESEKMASLGEMVAAVSHELNTPIAFVQSNLSILSEVIGESMLQSELGGKMIKFCHSSEADVINVKVNAKSIRSKTSDGSDMGMDPAELQEMIDQSLSGITQMSELVANLKDFTRLDRNRTSNYDLNKGLDNVHYVIRSVIPEDVQIVKQFGDIPAVECMASQINQVFSNLIQNAAHAGAKEITLSTKEVDGRICASVSDNGSGIPADVLPKIFDSFFTTKGDDKGTGLGLYVSKDIIENHGGEITVESRPGKGTTFYVWLPIKTPDALRTAI